MYQGKFLAENRTAKPVAVSKKTAQTGSTEEIVKEALPVQEAAPQSEPVKTAPKEAVPVKTEEAPKKKKKGIRVGTIIFYLLYLMLIGAAVYGINYALDLLNDWLVVFEASQPDTRSQEIFNQYFADPDWGWVYDQAGLEGTEFEGKDAYVTYMENLVGDSELTYSKTSAGLSGGQKYIVKLDDQKVATFTMQNPITDELEIPQWDLSGVEAGFFTRNEDVTIFTQPGRTVTLNGVPLDETYVVKTTSSMVDSYLPEGIHAPRTATVYAEGFLVAPEVVVIDENGEEVELAYNAETNTYSETGMQETETAEISDTERNAVLNATYAYCKHMIGAAGANLRSYFDTSSAIYKTITKNELWFKGYSRYDFSEATITEYHRYTEDLFSARIQITLNTYRKDGSLKDFPINTTLFLQKNANGQWVVNNMTNVELHQTLTQVRITWMQNGEVLASEMVDASTNSLTPPAITVPEDKEFKGWFTESVDAEGNVTLSLVFAPTETGTISLADEYVLEPMVLVARFESKGE